MERELLELFEAAKRAADAAVNGSSSEEDRCIDALKLLKNFPVTMQILVSTQVGKRLRQLTKHPREKIQAKASDLLKYWKKIVIDETAENNTRHGNNSVNNPSSTKVEIKSEKSVGLKVEKSQKSEAMKIENDSKAEYIKVERTSKAEPIKIHDVSRTETIKVEKHTSAGSGKPEKLSTRSTQTGNTKKSTAIPINPPKLTSMVKCNDSVRDKLREILAEAFSKVSSEATQDIIDNVNACDPIRVAVSVESVMFEKLGRSNGPQKFKYRSIMFNLKDPNNPDLRRRVLLGEIKPDKLINMTPEEMASDQRKHENNQIKEKALFDCERAGAPKATTDQFKCGRCGQRKTTYYQLQTRSADEPMTTFVTCVNCNNHWKFC